tara:strand:- start:247 stop:498 length:252 start_codon:yes stop_codon:yes gene_type:complete
MNSSTNNNTIKDLEKMAKQVAMKDISASGFKFKAYDKYQSEKYADQEDFSKEEYNDLVLDYMEQCSFTEKEAIAATNAVLGLE